MTPGLTNRAILEIDVKDDSGTTRTGAFHLQEDLEDTGVVSKQYLLSNRGQYLREAYDVAADVIPEAQTADLESRRGYHVDGGAGQYTQQLDVSISSDEDPWGDGSADPTNPDDISKYDASGDCDLTTKKQIFEWYVTQSKTGSLGQARLYIGQWSDGTYADAAGVFGKPLATAIHETSVTRDPDEPSCLKVVIEGQWTAVFPEAAVDEALDQLEKAASAIQD